MLHLGWGEQVPFDVVGKEMLEHERGFVVLVPFGHGVPSLAVPRVGPEVNRNGGVVLSSPSHVEGDHVMGARVKEHVHLALFQRIQVTGNENAIGNIAGEFLKILPSPAGIENPPIEVGSKMSAGKPSVAATLGTQFLPCLIVIEAERGIPNGRDRGVNGRHPLVVNDRHGGGGSVFRSARHGDFALFKMIFFGVSGGDGPHQGGRPGPILNFEPGVEAFGEFLFRGKGHFALPVGSRFLDHGDDQTDSSFEKRPLGGVGAGILLQSGRRASSGQMKPFGFAVGGHDHADGDPVFLSGP